MDRTIALGYALNAQGERSYVDQNLVAGINGTDLLAADRNAVQEEIMGVIEGLAGPGSATNLKQMLGGILGLFNNASVVSKSGYISFRCGASPSAKLIFQWGSMQTTANSNATVVFPLAFPTECSAFLPVAIGSQSFGSSTSLVFVLGGTPNPQSCPVFAVNAAQPGSGGGAAAFSYIAVGY